MRFPEPHEIEERLRDIDRRIADGERAKQERAILEEFLKKAEVLFPLPEAAGPKFRKSSGKSPLSFYAEKVLRGSGKLHVSDLMDRMRKEGWVSTGDDRKDMKNVVNSLSPKRFVNLGANVWDLAKGEGEQ
jgi:hypothetical protein